MKFKPNIDAGWEYGPYEIYGRREGGVVLLYQGEEIGKFDYHSQAERRAAKHMKSWAQ